MPDDEGYSMVLGTVYSVPIKNISIKFGCKKFSKYICYTFVYNTYL